MSSENYFNNAKLIEYLGRVNSLLSSGSVDKISIDAFESIADSLRTISLNSSLWSQKCLYCINKYGERLEEFFVNINIKKNEDVLIACIILYAFFREFRYWTEDNLFEIADPSKQLLRLESALERYSLMIDSIGRYYNEIKSTIDRDALRFRLNKDEFQSLLDESLSRKAIDGRILDLTSLLDKKTQLIAALDEKISKLQTEYNFVGLYQGFQNVYKKKSMERKDSLKFVYALAVLLISVPAFIIFAAILHELFSLPHEENGLAILKFLALPIVSMELVLFYCFRLKYAEVKSYDAQLLQLDLRMSLCQFVEAYSKFATDIHKENPSLLSNFETLIFSPIVAKESDIPPLIDGANQIADLISKLKK